MPRVTEHGLRRALVRRLIRNAGLLAGSVLGALIIGAAGYHLLDGLPWLDAALNATMILTGMGPVRPVSTTAAKVFAIGYALFSGVFFSHNGRRPAGAGASGLPASLPSRTQ